MNPNAEQARYRGPRGGEQVSGVPQGAGVETVDVSMLLINAGVNFMKKNKKFTGAYILGLILLLFATGFAVSADQLTQYSDIMNTVDHDSYTKAEKAVYEAERAYYQSKGFFSCDAYCTERYAILQAAQARLKVVQSHNDVKVSNAKAKVGVFSEYGVQEARDLFWGIFAKGRGFAQQSSWYDMIFIGLGSIGSDESFAEVFIRWIIQLVMNFTIGMIGTFVAFVYSLWGLVTSYQPSYLAAGVFFVLASTAAMSLLVSFLAGLYFSAAGTAFVAAKAAGPNLRLGGGPRMQRRYIRQQRGFGYGATRPHYR